MAQNPLAAYLAPYCGKQGKLKTALGDAGLRSLWALCDGSPTEMGEFLAYADGCSQMTLECERLGLPVQKRNWANMNEAGFEGGLTVNDWRALYRKETSKKEKVKDWEWILPRGTEYGTLIGLSDLHLGPKEMDYARWEKLRDWIAATPSVRWIGLGDFLDVATVQSPTGAQILPYQAAKDVLRADLAPIASQCFGVLGGNHEARIVRATKCQENPMAGVAKDLGLHYYGMEAFTRIMVLKTGSKRTQTYDARIHHGFGSAGTEGGKINKLKSVAATSDVDFIMMGHVHALIAFEFLRAGIDEKGFVTLNGTPCAYTGSFLKWEQGSYSRDAGYAPAALGAGAMHLYHGRHSVHARS